MVLWMTYTKSFWICPIGNLHKKMPHGGEERNFIMEFKQAYEALKQGKDIKRPSWKGFWRKENGTIAMHCKDGRILKLTESEDIFYTVNNIVADDWEVVDGDNITGLDISTFTFGEAISRMKRGHKVARASWDCRVFIYLTEGSIVDFDSLKGKAAKFINKETTGLDNACICSHIDMKNAQGNIAVGWLASQADMLAEDWLVVE